MIVFFGPAGAGKSVQGQMLATRMGWSWLSTGQMLRESRDPKMIEYLQTGQLVSDDMMIQIVGDAFTQAAEAKNIILDGFPRILTQARWLIENQEQRKMELAVIVDVPREELLARMSARGRADDTPEAIGQRLDIYHREIDPILEYLSTKGIPAVHINGVGSVDEIHERIVAEITNHGIN